MAVSTNPSLPKPWLAGVGVPGLIACTVCIHWIFRGQGKLDPKHYDGLWACIFW